MRLLVTGGAGFIGASACLSLSQRHPEWEIVALDNLKRRGSELNLPRLRDAGVQFVHGDVRELSDLTAVGEIDAIVECSAEPSVMAGVDGSPGYVVQSNLIGAYHCLELARLRSAQMIFLSTSRVYPVAALESLALQETETRFELSNRQPVSGASPAGIAEDFPLTGARTIYGATKLSAELLIEEYRESYGLRVVVNRCGVIAGPWQMGKVDQGVFTFWLLAHRLGRSLKYIGFGGSGKQVRDLLHVEDLIELIDEQLADPHAWDGATLNVGGGREGSLSLLETTALCAEITSRTVEVEQSSEVRPGDLPLYVSDCAALFSRTEWRPRRGPREVLIDIDRWIAENEAAVRGALG